MRGRSLTGRQRQVLYWMATAGTVAGAAAVGHLSRRTVEHHLRDIRERLGLATTLECVLWLLREVPPPAPPAAPPTLPAAAAEPLLVPLIEPLPSRCVVLPEDAGSRRYAIPVVSLDGGWRTAADVAVAHDGQWLHVTIRADQGAGYDVFAALDFDGLRLPRLAAGPERVAQRLLVGQPGPGAWPGYTYFHRSLMPAGSRNQERRPQGLGSTSTLTGDGLCYGFRLPLWRLPLCEGRLELGLLLGRDGRTASTGCSLGVDPDGFPTHLGLALATSAGRPALAPPAQRLTRREADVLAALAATGRVAAAAERLDLAPDTVEQHLDAVRDKLQLPSSLACVVWAKHAGLVD